MYCNKLRLQPIRIDFVPTSIFLLSVSELWPLFPQSIEEHQTSRCVYGWIVGYLSSSSCMHVVYVLIFPYVAEGRRSVVRVDG